LDLGLHVTTWRIASYRVVPKRMVMGSATLIAIKVLVKGHMLVIYSIKGDFSGLQEAFQLMVEKLWLRSTKWAMICIMFIVRVRHMFQKAISIWRVTTSICCLDG
jgi:hypothetical protein